MAVVIGTNSGFVTTAPTADPTASATVIDNLAMAISDVTPASTGSISEIGWFCANSTQESNFEVGIYEDNGSNLPGDLIASYTTNAKGTGPGWKTVTVDIALSENTQYWIAVQLDNTSSTTFVDFSGVAQRRSIDNSSTQLVDPWVNEGISTPNAMAIYAVVEEETIQATNVLFSSVVNFSMDLDWTNGNGSKRAVFMKEASTGTASPVDNTTYTANTVFGSGDQIGSSGWYCVFNDTGTSVSVTGLNSGTTYRVHVCEYNE